MIKPGKNAHFLSDLLKKVDEMEPGNEVSAQVNSSFCLKNKIAAFTLAEVLVTLGIIGIVAAMTLPSVISNYKKIEYSTRLKKFDSIMGQVGSLYYAEHGTTLKEDWVRGDFYSADSAEMFWNTFYAPYFKNVVKTKKKNIYFHIYFADGSMLKITPGGACFDAFLDLNGDKGPNKPGRDVYSFLSCSSSNGFKPFTWLETYTIDNINSQLPEGDTPVRADFNNRDNVLKMCKYASAFCARLLFLDGWEYKDDYPYKL